MSDLLERAESVADLLLPNLFEEMNGTGQAGHCIYVSRVMGIALKRLGIRSEPLCVDYEFANSPAIYQLIQRQALSPPAVIAKTGSGEFDGYDHHVVTLVRGPTMALLLDLAIIQIERHIPGVTIPPIKITLPWPRVAPLSFDLNGGRLTYFFRPTDKGFLNNEQWKDILDARARANSVIRRMKS